MHIVLLGNNHRKCFTCRTDYFYFLDYLKESLLSFGAALHAYALMPTQVHLLITPLKEDSASKVVQQVGRRYVQHFNHQYQCSGTLWEGRYKSALVDQDNHLFSSYRYIEYYPERASLALSADKYEWSSHHFNAFGKIDPIITPHNQYLALAETHKKRQLKYRALITKNLPPEVIRLIEDAIKSNTVIGNKDFQSTIEVLTKVRLKKGTPGRPRIKKKEIGTLT